jgi:hypothetical protein
LDNLRLVYRAGQNRTYLATLEQDPATRQRETQQFDSLSISPPIAVATPWPVRGPPQRQRQHAPAPGPLIQLTYYGFTK